MRCLSVFLCICAMGLVPLGGCGDDVPRCETTEDCATGECKEGICRLVFECSEQGFRAAIARGGGPSFFDCDGPQRVVTATEIVIERNVTLDGERNLILDGNASHRVLVVGRGVTATLSGMTITGGSVEGGNGGGIANGGTLTLNHCTITENTAADGDRRGHGGGIYNTGTLRLSGSTVSRNTALGEWRDPFLCVSPPCDRYLVGGDGGGIANEGGAGPQQGPGIATLANTTVERNNAESGGGGGVANWAGGTVALVDSTVSNNVSKDGGGGIRSSGELTLQNSTLSGNATGTSGSAIFPMPSDAFVKLTNTLVDGDCAVPTDTPRQVFSGGYNIESPGNTCGFDQSTDQAGVSADDLKLGELANNGGPTKTHALGQGSVAIDQILEADCGQSADQRGEPRPETDGTMCDVGAFEVQP